MDKLYMKKNKKKGILRPIIAKLLKDILNNH